MRFSTSTQPNQSSRNRRSNGNDKLEGLRLFKARASFQTALLRARVSRAAHRLAHPLDCLHHDHDQHNVTPPHLPTPSPSGIIEHTLPHRDSLALIAQRQRRPRTESSRGGIMWRVEHASTDEEYAEMAEILKLEFAFAMAKWEEMARMRMARQASGGSGSSGSSETF